MIGWCYTVWTGKTADSAYISLCCVLSACRICVFTCTLGLMALAVQCVVCASCQGPRGSLKVSGLNEPPRLDGWLCVCVHECVLLCDSGRIPWYKAVSLRSLCSHTRDALYFSPRVGWRGWGRVEGGPVWWLLAVCTVIAVLQLLCPWGKVMENIMGRP